MRKAAYLEIKKPESALSRIKRHRWFLLAPLYPLIWVWVLAFLLSLLINEPVQWDHQFDQDKSYVVFQVLPFKSWPVRVPLGKFEGTALTRNLQGTLETSNLWQVWLIPIHFQVAHPLAGPPTAPLSAFSQSIRLAR